MDRFDQMAKALFPAHPHFRGGVAQALRTVRAEALEEAAKACREYAHSGDVSMMRRQVAYACERRVRELKENGDSGPFLGGAFKPERPDYYWVGGSTRYSEQDPEVTCRHCKQTFRADAMDAACRFCGKRFSEKE